MRYIYDKLLEDNLKKSLRESVVGVFYIINDEIYSDTTSLRNADEYGNFYNYGSHYDFYYDELVPYYTDMPWLKEIDYDYYPRGRVVYDRNQHKYILYIDPSLENDHYINMIAREFGLQNGGFYVDTEDEHYTHTGKDVV